ncbi:hypothetical protein K402DRAFT_248140 [Aulographum hederae CBS 113979]|uniref:Uncharacterized protein n=1 Tax=Aulographum hederae CBS 113979 TaxID=1176131 RepID=A0A6G1HAL8_9PEZI|nr:hypothetical protein K402DRAFT_248140 [Aulographum hederae CBS 113979]
MESSNDHLTPPPTKKRGRPPKMSSIPPPPPPNKVTHHKAPSTSQAPPPKRNRVSTIIAPRTNVPYTDEPSTNDATADTSRTDTPGTTSQRRVTEPARHSYTGSSLLGALVRGDPLDYDTSVAELRQRQQSIIHDLTTYKSPAKGVGATANPPKSNERIETAKWVRTELERLAKLFEIDVRRLHEEFKAVRAVAARFEEEVKLRVTAKGSEAIEFDVLPREWTPPPAEPKKRRKRKGKENEEENERDDGMETEMENEKGKEKEKAREKKKDTEMAERRASAPISISSDQQSESGQEDEGEETNEPGEENGEEEEEEEEEEAESGIECNTDGLGEREQTAAFALTMLQRGPQQ